jgi:sugar phosphate isomerase/epimerase
MSTPILSVQLYSVREALTADLDAALARLSDLGVRHVEAFDFVRRGAELAAAFERHGLAVPTGHAPLLSTSTPDRPVPPRAETFAVAKELGMRIVIDPFVAPARWADTAEPEKTAALLNEAAAEAADHGLLVGYHNHSHEFVHSFDGVTAYDVFTGKLQDVVVLEVDAFWAAAGGHDVPALVIRLGERVRAVHVKDGPIVADPFTAGEPLDPSSFGQVAAGEGAVPLAPILDAATDMEYAVLEFDHYAGDIFDGIARGIRFLNERGIG